MYSYISCGGLQRNSTRILLLWGDLSWFQLTGSPPRLVVECAPLPPYIVSELVLHFSSVALCGYLSVILFFFKDLWGKLQFTSNLIFVLLNYLLCNNVLSVERHKNGRIFSFFHLMPSKGAHTQALNPSILVEHSDHLTVGSHCVLGYVDGIC